PTIIPELDPSVVGNLVEVTPVAVLASHYVQTPIEEKQQVLVHWSGLTTQEATWEELAAFKDRFPQFNLEDKIRLEERGIDTSQHKSKQISADVGDPLPD
ncbi:hypothetical protein A2U01_0072279, partial [Trifolium medium]|nr:hypothetical protein [Trifolium medium]